MHLGGVVRKTHTSWARTITKLCLVSSTCATAPGCVSRVPVSTLISINTASQQSSMAFVGATRLFTPTKRLSCAPRCSSAPRKDNGVTSSKSPLSSSLQRILQPGYAVVVLTSDPHAYSHVFTYTNRPTAAQQQQQADDAPSMSAAQLRQLREAEVMHARWAMLGMPGCVVEGA